jgi:hypothetical protein
VSGVTAKYEVREAKNDAGFYYVLKAGETYPSREHAERGVEAAERAATDAAE